MQTLTCYLKDEAALLELAQEFAALSVPGLIILLSGDLGAGKTCWVRGYLQGLGYQGIVKSPTYTLVETYATAKQKIAHFDLYRLMEAAELEFIGLADYCDNQTTCLIEWPERAEDRLPPADLHCYLTIAGKGREFTGTALSVQGEKILKSWQELNKKGAN